MSDRPTVYETESGEGRVAYAPAARLTDGGEAFFHDEEGSSLCYWHRSEAEDFLKKVIDQSPDITDHGDLFIKEIMVQRPS